MQMQYQNSLEIFFYSNAQNEYLYMYSDLVGMNKIDLEVVPTSRHRIVVLRAHPSKILEAFS